MLRRSWPGVYSKSQRNAVNCEVEGLPCSRAPQKTGQRKNHQRKIHKQQSFSLQFSNIWNFMTVFFGRQAIQLGKQIPNFIEQDRIDVVQDQEGIDLQRVLCSQRKKLLLLSQQWFELFLVIFMASFLLMPKIKTVKDQSEVR